MIYNQVKSYYDNSKLSDKRYSKSAIRNEHIEAAKIQIKPEIAKGDTITNLYYRSIFY